MSKERPVEAERLIAKTKLGGGKFRFLTKGEYDKEYGAPDSTLPAKAHRYVFILSMPGNNSWNGKWSGEDNDYSVARTLTGKKAAQLKNYYSYSFGDGWVAGITIRPAKTREKVSNKFCGYEWMIDSILRYGEIRA
jgi:hypothetical protein